VASDGRLGAYSGEGGVRKKAWLLAKEGVHVTQTGRIQDFARLRWSPR
jgi:hypothetical protein